MSDLLYLLSDQQKYSVTTPTIRALLQRILPGGGLRFSRYTALNDPFESQAGIFSFSHSLALDPGELNRALKAHRRIGCFVSDSEDSVVQQVDETGRLSIARAVIACARWAHYAARHSGADAIAKTVAYRNHRVLPSAGCITPTRLSATSLSWSRSAVAGALAARMDHEQNLLTTRAERRLGMTTPTTGSSGANGCRCAIAPGEP